MTVDWKQWDAFYLEDGRLGWVLILEGRQDAQLTKVMIVLYNANVLVIN